MHWTHLLYAVLVIFAVWYIFRLIRGYPTLFNKENLGKSFFTLGILALILIAFIAVLVFLLKH